MLTLDSGQKMTETESYVWVYMSLMLIYINYAAFVKEFGHDTRAYCYYGKNLITIRTIFTTKRCPVAGVRIMHVKYKNA